MLRCLVLTIVAVTASLAVSPGENARAQEVAHGVAWGTAYGMRNMDRFYHYPYVYYPHNYWGSEYFRSSESLYFRYPPEMRVPVYNRSWHNYYPSSRRYHWGHHFMLDVF